MKHSTKLKLAVIHNEMDELDKSTEYMIAYMQDVANVSFDTVMNYFSLPDAEKSKLRKEARTQTA